MRSPDFYLLLITAFTEGLYIVFRNPFINKYNIHLLSASCGLSLIVFIQFPVPGRLLSVVSIIAAIIAKSILINKPFEKPDYRYLLILLGTLFIHFKI